MFRNTLVLLLCCLGVASSHAQYSQIVVFGDSLSDVGNLSQATFGLQPGTRYFDGRFSNGPVYSERLAAKLGLAPLRASRNDGTNYAYGGARTSGTTFFEGGLFIRDLDEQVDEFLESAEVSATALYVVFVGSNDFIQGDADNPAVRAQRVLNEIDRLTDAGARNLLSINLPMLGETPDGKANRDVLNARSREFNTTLAQGLDNIHIDGLELLQLDLAELFSVVLEEPNAFGLSNITSQGIEAEDAAGFLFWDGKHPTTQTHELFAEAAYRLVQPASALTGDFNLDRMLSTDDIDLLGRQILNQTDRLSFDLNQDAQLTALDIDELLTTAKRLAGDADFDGVVEFDDFLNLSGNFGRSDAELRWSDGDFDVNGTVGFADFLTLSQNFGASVAAVVVPEVNGSLSILVLLFLARRRRR